MPDLAFHKKLICNMIEEGISGELLESYIESCWEDAIKSVAPHSRLPNWAMLTDEEYEEFEKEYGW